MSNAVEVVMVAVVIAVVVSVDLSVEIVVVVDSIDVADIAVGALAADADAITNVGGIVQSFRIYCQEVLINPVRPSAT